MKPQIGAIAAMLLTVIVLVPAAAQAHSPVDSGGNESLATATPVEDPTKSWAVYADLHEGGEAQYYTFDIAWGQTIQVQLFTTTSPEDVGFTPSMALMGPGIPRNDTAPDYVEMPQGAGRIVVAGTRPAEATYEAFSPSSFVELGRVTMPAPANGTFVVAVFDEVRGGRYGLAIGTREAFTASEWILMPFSLLSVYTWERQDPVVVLAPGIAVVAAGMGLAAWRTRKGSRLEPPAWAGVVAGLLFLASAAVVAGQMALSVSRAPAGGGAGVTAIFILLPLILGLVTIRMSLKRPKGWDLRSRAYVVVLGALALVLWAGWIAGPAIAMVAAVLPAKAPALAGENVPA